MFDEVLKRILKVFHTKSGPAGEMAELESFATKHFSEDFPNPNRENCPSISTLKALISSGELPETVLRQHLVSCSECFRQYRQLFAKEREGIKTVPAQARTLRANERWGPILVGTATGAVLFLGLMLLLLFRSSSQEADKAQADFHNRPGPIPSEELRVTTSPPASDLPPHTSELPTVSDGSKRGRSTDIIAENRVVLDLKTHSLLRDSRRAKTRALQLEPRKNVITIKLASGSPSGEYQVSLTDSFGNPIHRIEEKTHNGVQLKVALELTQIKPGKYMICVTRKTEVPECVPAVLSPIRKPQ